MGWLRLESRADTHPKSGALSDLQFGRWVRVLLHCTEHETDGLVSPAILKRIGADQAKLLELGLLEDRGGELWVHDYLEYNPSRAQKEKERERWKESKRASRKGANVHAGQTRDNAGSHGPSACALPSPKPLGSTNTPSPTTDSREGDFGNLDPSTALLVTRLLARLPNLEPGKADYIRSAAARLPESVTAGVLELLEAGGHVRDPVAYVIGALTRELRDREAAPASNRASSPGDS